MQAMNDEYVRGKEAIKEYSGEGIIAMHVNKTSLFFPYDQL